MQETDNQETFHDPEDEAPPTRPMPALGKVFTFQGRKLEPFSSAREALYVRMTFGARSIGECAMMLIYICTQSAAKCVTVCGEREEVAFRLAQAEWSDAVGWMHQDREKRVAIRKEAEAIYSEITGDVSASGSVEPDLKGGTSGNE